MSADLKNASSSEDAAGWRAHADALAAFAMATLPNRTDVWGVYVAPPHRATWGKVLTAPRRARRGLDFLTASVLAQHFRADDLGHVIGLHTTSPDNTSRWGGLDFDVHEEGGIAVSIERRRQIETAVAWCVDAMGERGAILMEDSDGDGGRHLWMRFDAPVCTAALFVWLVSIVSGCAEATGYRPETFPKQPRLSEGQVGNWLRLPGHHHTRTHWSRLCRPGEAWARGRDAAEVFLDWPATPVDAIPPISAYPQPDSPATPISPPRTRVSAPSTEPPDRSRAITRYIEKLPHGSAGSGRSDVLFRLAAFLRHDMQCTTTEALPILHAWNAGNMPPLSDAKILDTWENAGQYGGRGGRRAA